MNEIRSRAWLRSLRLEQQRQGKAIEALYEFGLFDELIPFKHLSREEWKDLVDSNDSLKKMNIEAPETPEEVA